MKQQSLDVFRRQCNVDSIGEATNDSIDEERRNIVLELVGWLHNEYYHLQIIKAILLAIHSTLQMHNIIDPSSLLSNPTSYLV